MRSQTGSVPTWVKVVLGLVVLIVSGVILLIVGACCLFGQTSKDAQDPERGKTLASEIVLMADPLPSDWDYTGGTNIGVKTSMMVNKQKSAFIVLARYPKWMVRGDNLLDGQLNGAHLTRTGRATQRIADRELSFIRADGNSSEKSILSETAQVIAPNGDAITIQAIETSRSEWNADLVQPIYDCIESFDNTGTTQQRAVALPQDTESTVSRRPEKVENPLDENAQGPEHYLDHAGDRQLGNMDNHFVRYQFRSPLNDPNLSCYFVAPKSWTTSQVTDEDPPSAQPCQLAELDCESPRHISLEAWYQRLENSKTLSECFDEYSAALGFTVVEKQEGGNRIEALVKYDSADMKNMLSRVTMVRVGRNVFWLCGCAPANSFGRLSKTFSIAADTFSPVGYAPLLNLDIGSKSVQSSVEDD